MSIGTREDAKIMARVFAKILLKVPKEYRKVFIGGFFLLQMFAIYYLHTTLHK